MRTILFCITVVFYSCKESSQIDPKQGSVNKINNKTDLENLGFIVETKQLPPSEDILTVYVIKNIRKSDLQKLNPSNNDGMYKFKQHSFRFSANYPSYDSSSNTVIIPFQSNEFGKSNIGEFNKYIGELDTIQVYANKDIENPSDIVVSKTVGVLKLDNLRFFYYFTGTNTW